jgi:ferric-dicitrate binding protein FerR (iron transport regulator)
MPQSPSDSTPFTVEELIWHDPFRAWVLRPTPELAGQWHTWQAQHPDQLDTLLHAREVVLALRVNDRPVTDAEIQRIITVTRQHLDRPTPLVRPLWSRSNWVVAASVALLLLLGAGYWWQSQLLTGTDRTVTPPGLISSGTAAQIIRLADGSTVHLSAGSRLRYPQQFTATKREVYLTGTATFNVARNPDQPFLVHANGSVTRVLGTRFTVQAPAGGNRVTVNVLSGKVSVLPESEWERAQRQAGYQPRTVIVTPNQQVVFEPAREQMRKSIVAAPIMQHPVDARRFNFVETPVAQVFNILEEAYGIPVVFDADQMRQCVVTAPLADEPLLDKLDIICETIGARYEVIEAQIVISGKGCAL